MLNCTPSFLQGLELPKLPHLKRILASGEECKKSLAKRYAEDYDFYNEYGPTETTVIAISGKVTPETLDRNRVSIGRPIANTKALILDVNMKLVPIGSMGHLYISGAGVAQGYLNRPELTKTQFIDNPYAYGKAYKTGDLARWLPDGTIEFLGRSDNQIKLNGIRIELGEIESHLNNIERIKDVVVDLRQIGDNKSLVAYYVSEKSISNSEFRSYLIDRLPFSMIPYYYVQMDEFPLSSNGKLDQRMLPNPENQERVYAAPSNKTEELLVSIWSKLLERELSEISIHDGFFELGGNSLKAISLVNEISKSTSVKISLKEIFVKRTVEKIADYILTVQQMKETETSNQEDIKIII
jgi:acyl-CoA synthetase (AMP-forming)/AMP-acid ligase II/acyl carrier protein